MGENSGKVFSVEKLLKAVKGKSCSRYVLRKGKKIKSEDYEIMDAQDKEALELRDTLDWAEVDKKLDELNHEYEREKDPIQREILFIKYELMVESHVGDEPHRINQLKLKLNKLLLQ